VTIKEFLDYIKEYKDIENREIVFQIGNNFPEKLETIHLRKEEDGTFLIHVNHVRRR